MGISIEEYRAIMANQALKGAPGRRRGGNVLRMAEAPLSKALVKSVGHSGEREGVLDTIVRKSSAQKARDRTSVAIDSLVSAKVDVEYDAIKKLAIIKIIGGTTLPHNRVANIGREQSGISQRTFAAYKHACAARAADAVMLLRAIKKAPIQPSDSVFIEYERIVDQARRKIDSDAVVISFKWILDGLVDARLLIDDSDLHVRLGEGRQSVAAQNMLIIRVTGV